MSLHPFVVPSTNGLYAGNEGLLTNGGHFISGKKDGGDKYRPGQEVPVSGQYGLYGPRGGYKGVETTATKGEPFSPTPGKNMTYQLHDATKHRK